jgi:PAS domain S-box-containing protein
MGIVLPGISRHYAPGVGEINMTPAHRKASAAEPSILSGVCAHRPGGTGITERRITDSRDPAAAAPARRKPSQQALAAVLSGGVDIGALIRAPDGYAPRILVGEADRDMRDRVCRVLASAGCRVETAGDGRAAFAAAIGDPPDLIVADAAPRRNGFALLRLLRADPLTKWLPVIVLSAETGLAAKREALDAGADDYLVKPFGARELLARVGLHLAMARVGREASEAVRASERRLAEVLEAIGEAVFAMDRAECVLFANRKALELWNKPAEAVIGRHVLDVFPGIEKGEPYLACRRVLSTGEPVHLETTAPAFGGRWIGLDAYPAPQGGLVVAFRDIDERKRAEAGLRDSEERFRLMLEALPDKAFVIRPDGTAENYNQQLRDYVGAPIGTAPWARSALHPPLDRERVDSARAQGFATGEEFIVEARMRRHDGVYRWHRISNRPVRIDGAIAFWLGTAVDIDDMHEANALLEWRVAERTAELEAANRRLAAQIDEREKAETRLRQAQRIEAVGQLTSGVAHDFNNLLTAIIGNLELLEGHLGRADERAVKLLAAAAAGAERGARLTAQLLAFSRQQQMSPEPVNLNRIVGSLGALLQSTLGATIRIETVVSAKLWPALADASQIELVLLNLAFNARDAMPASGTILEGALPGTALTRGTITIETANVTLGFPERPEEPPPGDYAMVSVADTGSGIAPAILDKVFDPFFTTKEVGKGSGLGLSQVLGVAQQLGGGVHIDTRPGESTIVKVFLPRARIRTAARRRIRANPRAVLGGGTERRSRLILLVDDDSDVRAVAAAMLAEAGYRVIEAASGRGALECLEQDGGAIALMIADIAMPEMSGVELARAARVNRPDLPVLFVTGFAGAALPPPDAAQTGPGANSGRLLRKPFRAAELAASVAALIDEYGTRGTTMARLRSRV